MKFTNFIKKHSLLLPIFTAILSTLIIFNGVLQGKIISNNNHIFNFEPWIHKYKTLPRGNYILSDMVDGAGSIFTQSNLLKKGKIPIWDYSDKLGNIGIFNILNNWFYPLRTISWLLFDIPIGWTIEILLKFVVGFIFLYLFLRKIGLNFTTSIITSIGFTFGSNNISEALAGFSTVPLTIPITLYYAEKLIQSNKWKDSIYFTLSLILLTGAGFVSISFFSICWIGLYLIYRIITSTNKSSLIVKTTVSCIFSILIFLFALLPTADFFSTSINLDYRQNYGTAQLPLSSAIVAFFANFYGHPLYEANLWSKGTYINTSIFVGFFTITAFLATLIPQIIRTKSKYFYFFLFSIIFLIFNIYETPFEKLEYFTNSLPLFHGNRPSYQKTILQLFIAIIGGISLDYSWNLFKRNKIVSILINLTFVIISIISLRYFYNYVSQAQSFYLIHYFKKSFILIIAQNLLFFLWLNIDYFTKILHKKIHFIKPTQVTVSLTIIAAIIYLLESFVHSRNWIPYSHTNQWLPQTQTTDYLLENIGDGRVVSLGIGPAVPTVISTYGIPSASGRGSVPDSYKALLQTIDENYYDDHGTQTFFDDPIIEFDSPLWDIIDVRYFIASKWFDNDLISDYKQNVIIHKLDDATLIEKTPSPQHAYLIPDGYTYKNIDDLKSQFIKYYNARNTIAIPANQYLLKGDNPTLDNVELSPQNKILSYNQETNKITINIVNTQPIYLLISSAFHKGWKAKINGINTEVFPAYGFLSAIPITTTGEQTITMIFFPDSLFIGLTISIASLIIYIILIRLLIKQENYVRNFRTR